VVQTLHTEFVVELPRLYTMNKAAQFSRLAMFSPAFTVIGGKSLET